MAPTIHIVRHGEAAHNIAGAKPGLVDPELTLEGYRQCGKLREVFPYGSQVKHVVASPMARAVQTALLAAVSDETGPPKLLDSLQEVYGYGSSLDKLREVFGDGIDLDNVCADWTKKDDDGSVFYPDWDRLIERARRARRFVSSLVNNGDDNAHIIVVTHGAFVHFVTEDWDGLATDSLRSEWANCEYRSFHFVDQTGQDSNASLRETTGSWKNRKGNDIEQPDEASRQTRQEEARLRIEPRLNAGKRSKRYWTK